MGFSDSILVQVLCKSFEKTDASLKTLCRMGCQAIVGKIRAWDFREQVLIFRQRQINYG